MNKQEINIKNKILHFIAIMFTGIVLTVGYLVWMTHQTYSSRTMITKDLIPNVKILSEIRSDVLVLVSEVRECLKTDDLAQRNSLLADVQRLQTEALHKIEDFESSVQGNAQGQAYAQQAKHHYLALSTEISSLLHQLPPQKIKTGLMSQFPPVFKSARSTILAIDASLDANLKQTEDAFNALEYVEISNMGIYLISIVLLLGLLYFAGQKTYKSIIGLLGSEPSEFINILNGLLEGKQVNVNDVSENSLVSKLKQSILFDKETGVLNKLGLFQHYPAYFTNDQHVVGVLIKIQGLDELSDFIGANHTNVLLMQLVDRLKQLLPSNSILARVSNASFIWVTEDTGNDPSLVTHIENVLEKIQQPYSVGIRHLKIKIFAGIIKLPQDTQNFKLLVPHATIAALKAENSLKQYMFFAPGFLQESLDYVETETALSHALENKEFELYLQPQIEINTGKVSGAEALLRWKHPTLGFIPPDKFIPIAERNGQILEIGDWVLTQGILYAVEINQHADSMIPIAINISSHQIQASHFYESFQAKLAASQCDPAWIKLEITESVLLDKSEDVLRTLLQIAALGITISLDDFGTGYSSLSYLTKYPISQIKIDRTFMSDIPLHLDNTELVKAIIKLAEILHFEVVAEGIESLDQLNFLKKTSCALVQGYYFFKPMPFENFKQHVLAYDASTDGQHTHQN